MKKRVVKKNQDTEIMSLNHLLHPCTICFLSYPMESAIDSYEYTQN